METPNFGLFTQAGAPVPLTGVAVQGEITGRAARVKVAQRFENREDTPIEAVYKFPLAEAASVCGFKIETGERTVTGEIEEKEQAFVIYDEALAAGHGAFLLDMDRPNIFNLSVGNVLPRHSAVVEVEYISLLDTAGGSVRFSLPTTISPRYVPENTPDEAGIPVADIVNPPFALKVPYGLTLDLAVRGKEDVEAVESPSHHASIAVGDDAYRVSFAQGEAAMDRDFILNIRYKKSFQSRAYFSTFKGEGFLQVDFCPGDAQSEAPAKNPEIVFVLDCSGSMQGSSIAEAKKALEVQLKGLREGTFFNIYRFGSTFNRLYTASKPYGAENLKAALDFLTNTQADLGGTELMAPLSDILGAPPAASEKAVALLTDGEVGNEDEIFALLRSKGKGVRFYTVGIGHGPNEHLLKDLARLSCGACEMISPGERIEFKSMRLFGKIGKTPAPAPVISGLSGTAATAPCAYAGECLSLFARTGEKAPTEIELSVPGRKWKQDVVSVPGDPAPALLWAREMIRSLEGSPAAGSRQEARTAARAKEEIVSLSKKYGVLSRETSFVGVEQRASTGEARGEMVLRRVPVQLTRGWHGGLPEGEPPGQVVQGICAQPSPVLREDNLPSFLRRARPMYSRQAAAPPLKTQNSKPKTGEDKGSLALEILSSQEPGGGLRLSAETAGKLGLSPKVLAAAAAKMTADVKADKLLLLHTALALALLKRDFQGFEWQDVTAKSEAWLAAEIVRARPQIDGLPLGEWVSKLLEKVKSC